LLQPSVVDQILKYVCGGKKIKPVIPGGSSALQGVPLSPTSESPKFLGCRFAQCNLREPILLLGSDIDRNHSFPYSLMAAKSAVNFDTFCLAAFSCSMPAPIPLHSIGQHVLLRFASSVGG
jgi:hypothetical protein